MSLAPVKVLEELFKSRFAQLKADIEYSTQVVSQTTRIAALGLCGLLLPFISAEEGKLSPVLKQSSGFIIICAFLGAIAIICDIIQNSLADKMATLEIKRIVENLKQNKLAINSPSEFLLENNSWFPGAIRSFYFIKIFTVVAGILLLIIVISVDMKL